MKTRPILSANISVNDFQNFYWLKKELTDFCKKEGLSTQGGKIEIAQRIIIYLQTGKKEKHIATKSKSTSKFDWKNEQLSLQTIITDNYKNTENVRAFFQEHTDQKFKFNVKFMNWMKANIGKTLADAIQQWELIYTQNKNRKSPKEIAPQFEYNRYVRDFLADNSNLKKADAIRYWKLKKTQRGDNVYQKSDLKLIDS